MRAVIRIYDTQDLRSKRDAKAVARWLRAKADDVERQSDPDRAEPWAKVINLRWNWD